MSKTRSTLLSCLLFLGFIIGGLAVGLAAGLAYNFLSHMGWLADWRPLNSSLRFAEIVDVTSQEVWARADNGKLYYWDLNCYRKCNTWIEVPSVPVNKNTWGELPMEKGVACLEPPPGFRKPPVAIRECARAWFPGPEYGVIAYYVLSPEGDIWVWDYSSSMIGDFVAFGFSVAGGFLLAIVAYAIYVRRSHRLSVLDPEIAGGIEVADESK